MLAPDIKGTCDPAFAGVADAFREGFARRGEIGAAVALVRDGELVVDLWGGVRSPRTGAPWVRGTTANVWSTTKGVVATCFAMLADRSLIDYEARVASYWPAFAACGKDEVTVAQLLSHQGGLCGFDTPASLEDYLNQPHAEARLAAQRPLWAPSSACGYHALSFGPLADGLFRRIEGRPLRAFVAAELRGQLGLELAIGLPSDWRDLAADLIAPPDMSSADAGPELSPIQRAALANPAFDPAVANGTEWRSASLPSANGFATARGLARLYGALAQGGRIGDHRLLGAAALEQATAVRIDGPDLVLGLRARWASGYLRNVHGLYGASERAFGHSGWGGSFAFADPDARLALAYVPNRMGSSLVGEPRATALVAAAYG